MKNPQNESEIGSLPNNYKSSDPSNRNRFFWIVPLIICGCLFWFAYNQWQNPPNEWATIPKPKERVWWMPDLMKSLPPFADGYRFEKYLKKYNLTSCLINGNFEQINSAISCFLFNPAAFPKNNISISTYSNNPVCGNRSPLTLAHFNEYHEIFEKNPARRIMWIQDPLERFARQFHRFCEQNNQCFNCGSEISCFMRKILIEHRKLAQGLAGNIRTVLTNNFSPQTWNCHLHSEFKLVEQVKIGGNATQITDFLKSYSKILKEQGVEESYIDYISNEVIKIPLNLSKREEEIMNEIRNDVDKKRLFRYLYEHDYTVFGFKTI